MIDKEAANLSQLSGGYTQEVLEFEAVNRNIEEIPPEISPERLELHINKPDDNMQEPVEFKDLRFDVLSLYQRNLTSKQQMLKESPYLVNHMSKDCFD